MEIIRIDDASLNLAQHARENSASLSVGQTIDCADFSPSQNTLFHGTPIHPDQMGELIFARQAQRRIDGQLINHGPRPAVSTSSNLVFPVMRSLLHEGHGDIGQDFPVVLNRREDNEGRPFIFTAAAVIKRLVTRESVGFVYATNNLPSDASPFTERTDLAEWRVPGSMRWEWVGRTSVEDLPPHLLIVDASTAETQNFLSAFTQSNISPLELSRKLGITVTHFADYWKEAGDKN